MGTISSNIKYLRKRKGLTQGDLAERIGIKRSLVGAYEEGRADPRIENLKKLSKYFDIDVDILISKDLSKLTDAQLATLKQKDAKGLRVLSITVDADDHENIHLVPQRAAAGYLNGYSDPEYVAELPKFKLPMLPDNASYRAFEITGDSMLPIEPGTVVVGEYIEKLDEVKNGKTYVLVTKKEGIVFKRVFNYVKENGKLFLSSDNKAYSPYELQAEELIEIWVAKAFISVTFPEPEDKEVLALEELTTQVLDLKAEIRKLSGK